MDRFLYAHPAKYYYCDGTRSVAHTGEVLPHSNGEVMLAVVGVGHVWSGFSPLCTHAFITSAALRQPYDQHYSVMGPPFAVICGIGSTLHALGTVCLPVRVHGSLEVMGCESDQHVKHEAKGVTTGGAHSASIAETDEPITVMLTFVIVEGETKECMLDAKAFSLLGLSEHKLTRTVSDLSDPAATFQRACLLVHRAQGPATGLAYYPLPQGTPPPCLSFGIGHTAIRAVKGVLVMMQPAEATGNTTFRTHPVLEGRGANVHMASPRTSQELQSNTSDRDVGLMALAIAHVKEDEDAADHGGKRAVETEASRSKGPEGLPFLHVCGANFKKMSALNPECDAATPANGSTQALDTTSATRKDLLGRGSPTPHKDTLDSDIRVDCDAGGAELNQGQSDGRKRRGAPSHVSCEKEEGEPSGKRKHLIS